MKIIRLESENVKRLKAIEITPEGNMVIIGGENAAGKSSVLDSIMYAIGGKSCVPGEPIHRGEESAIITVELDDLIVTRSFTPTDSYLKVSNKEGASFKSPQAMLDKLVGKLSFDPLEFLQFKPQEQLEMLRSLVGIDFTELDQKRQAIYDNRRYVNRDIEKMKGTIALNDYPQDTPDKPVNVDDLMAELKKGQEHNQSNESKRRELQAVKAEWYNIKTKIDGATQRINEIEAELASLKENREDFIKEQTEIKHKGEGLDSEVKALIDVELEPIEEKIRTSNEINIAVRNKEEKKLYQQELKEMVKESDSMTKAIKQIDEDKKKALSEAEFPVEGLSFGDGIVTFNDIPFDQASGMEQIKVSLAMGVALNPELRVLLIREGGNISEKSLKMIAEWAKEKDVQLWIEDCRSTSDEATVMIEDGMVKVKGE